MIGDIIYNDLNDEKRLPCTGNAYPIAEYPELAAICDKVPGTNIDLQSTVSGVPSLAGDGRSVAFSPDGNLLAMAHSASPYLTVIQVSDWSVVSGTPTLPGDGNGVAFSPDGQYLAVAHDGTPYLTIIRTSDWSEVSGVPALPGDGNDVAFSNDGQLLAAGHTDSPGLTVIQTSDWSVVSGTPTISNPVPFPDEAFGVSFSPDGQYLAVSAYDPALRVFRTGDWSGVSIPALGTNSGNGVAFSPDGQYLAAGSSGGDYISVLSTSDWSTVSGPYSENPVLGIAFSRDSQLMAIAYPSVSPYLVVLRTSDWSEIADTTALLDSGAGVSFSPDNQYLAAIHDSSPYLTVINVTQDAPDGYFHVPNIPMQEGINIDYPVLIQAEE